MFVRIAEIFLYLENMLSSFIIYKKNDMNDRTINFVSIFKNDKQFSNEVKGQIYFQHTVDKLVLV